MSFTELLSLCAALGTPWVLGTLLLRLWLPAKPTESAGVLATQLGYGFFLGYAISAGLLGLAATALGTFPFYPLLGVLILVCATLLWLELKHRRLSSAARASLRVTHAHKWLSGLLLLAIALHLGFALLEILHRPVFPWDAWLNWMYRAKVWVFNDAMLPFTEPDTWAVGTRATPYNVDGAHYPKLVPLIATWSALGLGRWSETLVNLPTFGAGVALALGFYGQCRATMPRVWALGACYTLVSIPLLGAHLALAGQADIWLSGYAGLGLLALLRGSNAPDSRTLALGLLFCAIGLAVKVEGTLWLLLALMLLASARAGVIAVWLSLVGLSALIAASWLVPASTVQTLVSSLESWWPPLSAGAGQTLLDRQLADDYLQNYLLGGSWHLAGWISATCLLVLLLRKSWRRSTTARLAIVFFALQGSALILIFNFSQHGAWAEDWTAINRLPLQLIAVHVYLWFRLLCDATVWRPPILRPQNTFAGLALGLGCFATVAGAAALTLGSQDHGQRIFPAETLRVVVGGGANRGGLLWLERYQDGLAIASSGPVSLAATELSLVTLTTGGRNQRGASFFVRGAADRDDLKTLDLPTRGTAVLDLSKILAANDRLVEFGVLSYHDAPGRPLSLGSVRFSAPTPTRLLGKFWNDWTTAHYWSFKSAHWLPAGRAQSMLPLPLVAALGIILLGSLLMLRFRRRRELILPVLLPALLLAWLVLDARWLTNLIRQGQRTVQDYPLLTANSHAFSDDTEIRAAVSDALGASADSPATLVIMGQRADLRYQLLRAKYHAAPRPALVPEPPSATAFKAGDQLLLLRSAYEGGDRMASHLRTLESKLAREGLRLSEPVVGERSAYASLIPLIKD